MGNQIVHTFSKLKYFQDTSKTKFQGTEMKNELEQLQSQNQIFNCKFKHKFSHIPTSKMSLKKFF